MFWLLLVTATLILGRTYIWSIMLWVYGRAGQSEARASSEPLIFEPSPQPTTTIPPFCGHRYRPAPGLFLRRSHSSPGAGASPRGEEHPRRSERG